MLPGLRRRLASMLYEALLLLGVLSVTFLLPHLALGLGFGITLPGPLLLAHMFLVTGAYFLWYWRRNGQTLAMQTWKLQLCSVTGGTPTIQQLVLRYLLSWPSLVCYGAGIVWAIFDREHQFLHDRLAGTRIEFREK